MLLSPPTTSRISAGHGRTAFERTLLPGFARWFVDQVAQCGPDYLVPVETKGARLLEAVLDYARDVLGTPIRVPILYATSLAYLPRAMLEGSRILVLEDAIKTGANLHRQRIRIADYGAMDVHAVACIGHTDEHTSEHLARCYRLVDADLYREYIWQLAELVVARGLPPEVDHHVFALQVPLRLTRAWERLREVLSPHGDLSIDGPLAHDDETMSMTLHFPILPGVQDHPQGGEIRSEGVQKIRLFADRDRGGLFVVPMSFPALDLPTGTPDELPLADVQRQLRAWTGRGGGIGELLVSEAQRRNPETVFRVLSTCAEVDLVSGLARVLAHAFPDGGVSLTVERELSHRLYGRDVGERIAAHIDHEIAEALTQADVAKQAAEPAQPLRPDAEVITTTREIVRELKSLHDEHAEQPDYHPLRRIGWSFSEMIQALVEASGPSSLTISRCLDFGLAMTTLVPYVDVDRRTDGSVCVRRKYRVSESEGRGEGTHEDRDGKDCEISEETVALIAHVVQQRSRRYDGVPLPTRLLAQLVATLRPVLDQHRIALRVTPGEDGPVVVLLPGEGAQQKLLTETSRYYTLENDAIQPTPDFHSKFEAGTLRLERGASLNDLEGFIALLVQVLDDPALAEDALDPTLTCWAMNTDGRLGLTHVRHDLDAALDLLERPLKLIVREVEHRASQGLVASSEAHVEAARGKLAQLAREWAPNVRAAWPRPLSRERTFLDAIAVTPDRETALAFPGAVAKLITAVGLLVERLEACSLDVWTLGADVDEPATIAAAHDVEQACATIEHALRMMSDPTDTTELPLRGAAREAISVAAERMLGTVAILRAFTAACSGIYLRGLKDEDLAREPRREATVLFADMKDSSAHKHSRAFDAGYLWKEAGLNLIAQWGAAFGGREVNSRPGDAVCLEFASADDAAVLCAAAVQQHLRVLRSTGLASLSWGFRITLDQGQLKDGTSGNVYGPCIDRAAHFAGYGKLDADAVERVLITPEAARSCSTALMSEPIAVPFGEVVLAEGDDPQVHFPATRVDADHVMTALCAQLHTVAHAIAGSMGRVDPADVIVTADEGYAPDDMASESS